MLLVAFRPSDVEAFRGFLRPTDGELLLVAAFEGAVAPIGAARVYRMEEGLPADAMAEALAPVAQGHALIAAPASVRAKDVIARLAGRLGWPMVSEAIARVEAGYDRPIYAGALIETVQATGPVVVTFRAGNFPAGPDAGSPNGPEEPLVAGASKVQVSARERRASSRPDLASAQRVVSGGRPLKTAEAFERVLGGFADTIGAAVGATRAAVDSGIAPNELQVGQTGKIVAPELYIAAGVSGSTQHMAGIKDSKVIVAINKDPDAPIFEAADYGLVGDLYEILPQIEALYRARGHGA